MARWKARVEFLLSVIGLLFLSLTVEALQGKMCQNSLPSGGGRSLGVGANIFRGKGSSPCQYIDTTRNAIDCATTLPPTFLYNETLQQTFRPVFEIAQKTTNLVTLSRF